MTAHSISGQQILNPFFSWKRIPYTLRVALIATFVIGIVAHFFCYTNVFFNHDAAAMYWSRLSLADSASGSRWLTPLWQTLVACVQMPWLEGLITLFFYGISAWLVCEVLQIRYTALIVLVSGILITSPTAISSNMYLSSAHQYSGALLFACLALYAFERWKHGWLWAFFSLLVSAGTYGAYVNVSVSLFLLLQIVRILSTVRESPVRVLGKHVCFLVTFLASMIGTQGIISFLLWRAGEAAQGRVDEAIHNTMGGYLNMIGEALDLLFEYFSPFNDLSFFQENRFYYGLFVVTAFCALAVMAALLVHNKLWRQPLRLLILAVDILCMPLAMNLIGMFYFSHTLMQFAFVTPWVLFVCLAQTLFVQPDLLAWVQGDVVRARAFAGYALLVVALSVVAILNGIYLANVAYMKSYAIYESSISLTNRIVDRIEATPGYVAGETRVLLIGDVEKHYAPYREGFAVTDSLTGIGRYSWDTSLTYNLVLATYIEQQLGIQMEILNPNDSVYPDTAAQFLAENDVSWGEESRRILEQMEDYPSQNCISLRDDVLIIKFSD